MDVTKCEKMALWKKWHESSISTHTILIELQSVEFLPASFLPGNVSFVTTCIQYFRIMAAHFGSRWFCAKVLS